MSTHEYHNSSSIASTFRILCVLQEILHYLLIKVGLLRNMLSRRMIRWCVRLLCILAVSIICSVVIVHILFISERFSTQIIFQNSPGTYNSCHSVVTHVPNSGVQRCYPLLINFAHKCCRRSQRKNCLTGLQYGIQQCVMFNMQNLANNPMFFGRNKKILDRTRGGGYWLWKPYIIFQELYLAQDGDIIVYSDALVNVVANISYLTELTTKQDIVVFQLTGFKESIWMKRDTLILLNADKPEYTETWSNLASYMVVKKSFTSVAFVSEWLAYAQDPRAITDDDNVLGFGNYPDFRDHRHDQAIMSLLAKKWNLTVYPDPSQWGEMHKRPYPTIFDHHRSKGFLDR
ncbi:hypothetical protein I4U23_012357 [Adineta vaga]|nr:hypothetical protein I4U23_012357 [Adineta vaga]